MANSKKKKKSLKIIPFSPLQLREPGNPSTMSSHKQKLVLLFGYCKNYYNVTTIFCCYSSVTVPTKKEWKTFKTFYSFLTPHPLFSVSMTNFLIPFLLSFFRIFVYLFVLLLMIIIPWTWCEWVGGWVLALRLFPVLLCIVWEQMDNGHYLNFALSCICF